ncbi:uncharacterized protein VTP21DRAFT_2318 [Calcarisporiella thermophila]|uniref:uncharacterized protein n=1 Tax=Calcarisporiella thermophila TaxID=911321 RepID=UPI00374223CB
MSSILYRGEDEQDDLDSRSVLPVSERADLNPENPPATGEEYLRLVRMEARKRPAVVVAQKKPPESSSPGKLPKSYAAGPSANPGVPTKWVPDLEWQETFLKSFEAQRKHFSKTNKHEKMRHKLPKTQDEQGWMAFCYGDAKELSKDEEISAEGNEEKVDHLSAVNSIDQRTALQLLKYHTKWIGPSISVRQSQWIYALLLRIDKAMTSDQMFILRDLCRRCMTIRSQLEGPTDPCIASLNIFITVVVKYFGQGDLG